MRRALILTLLFAASGALRAAGAGRRRRARRPAVARDRVEELQQELDSLTEDVEDLGEPVEEFELFDECMYLIGVTQHGTLRRRRRLPLRPGRAGADRRSPSTSAASAGPSSSSSPSPARSRRASNATKTPARRSSTTERPSGRPGSRCGPGQSSPVEPPSPRSGAGERSSHQRPSLRPQLTTLEREADHRRTAVRHVTEVSWRSRTDSSYGWEAIHRIRGGRRRCCVDARLGGTCAGEADVRHQGGRQDRGHRKGRRDQGPRRQ